MTPYSLSQRVAEELHRNQTGFTTRWTVLSPGVRAVVISVDDFDSVDGRILYGAITERYIEGKAK